MNIFDHSFCVVGNSGCELRTGNGSKIDSYDIVFRFNNYSVDGKFSEDYGTKTTFWVTTFARDVITYEQNSHIQKFFCPLPLTDQKFLSRYCFTSIPHLNKFIHKTTFIPLETFCELQSFVSNPSTGMAFLYWLYKEKGLLNVKDIYGFSFFDKSFSHHYFDQFNECGHAGDIEKELFHKITR